MKGNRIAAIAVIGVLVLWALAALLFGRSISGAVLDAKTKKPVPDAFVRIGNITTRTDSQGQYRRWGFVNAATEVMIAHPAYLPNVKILVDADISKPVDIEMTHAGYEELLTNSTIYLKSRQSLAVKTVIDTYGTDLGSGTPKKMIDRIENVMVHTPDATWYAVQSSNSKDGSSQKQEVIIVGSDPSTPGTIRVIPGKPLPMIYILEKDSKEWLKFSIIEKPDFDIPFTDKDPKDMLIPLNSFGNTSEYEVFDDGSKTVDGDSLLCCKMYWPKDSLLRGKSITYKFRKDNGNWYDIEFFDNGENPGSKPGRYSFTLLDGSHGLMVQLPKDAKNLSKK